MQGTPSSADSATAILMSGGPDSAILVAETARRGTVVHPLYIRCGLRWEAEEILASRRFLQAVAAPTLAPLTVLDAPAADLVPDHWSVGGPGVPDERTADEAVYLPGRNILLLTKALLWCHLHVVPNVALATLRGNPFPDATAEFVERFAATVSVGLGGCVRVLRPYAELTKRDVLLRGRGLPLEWTLSCLDPVDGIHCGACNKCAERQQAFAAAELVDPTRYRNARSISP